MAIQYGLRNIFTDNNSLSLFRWIGVSALSKKRSLTIMLLVILLATPACGQIPAEEEPATAAAIQATAEVQEVTEQIQQEPTETQLPEEPTEAPETEFEGDQYWVQVQDPQSDVRYALPCFWEVNFPQVNHPDAGLLSYFLRNYTEEFAMSFPKGSGVWENGGIKIDILYFQAAKWGFSPGTSMVEFVTGLYAADSVTDLVSAEDVLINDQPTLFVTIESTYGPGQYYLFTLNAGTFLALSTRVEAMQDQDVQGILNSIALTPDKSVVVPDFVPGDPPAGIMAPCLGINELPTDPVAAVEGCMATSMDTPDGLALALHEALLARDIAGLQDNYMNDPMTTGYWGRGGALRNPDEMATELSVSLLPSDTSGLTFTTNREDFPPLGGIAPETMFGPDVEVSLVIYSEGWGADGLGGVLLFIARDECGAYYWHGLALSHGNFDQ